MSLILRSKLRGFSVETIRCFQPLFRHTRLLPLILLILLSLTKNVDAQKLPPIFSANPTDPSAFNIESIRSIKAAYDQKVSGTSEADREAAKQLRNRLIGIGREEVDAMFFGYLKSDRKNRERLQFLLDFLEIGTAAAISITRGERAKTVISDGLGALQASRTSLNKNFQLLGRQVLINKMEANRATLLTTILNKRNLDAVQYPWEDARADLRAYRDAGTLDSALSSLNSDVGKQKTDAEEKLREVKDKPITAAATPDDLAATRGAFEVENKLEADLSDKTKKDSALKVLHKIVDKLGEDKEVSELLKAKDISSTTDDGMKIITALDDIKRHAIIFSRRDLARKINLVIIEVGTQK
jgi:hypothetical protein